MVTTMVPVEYNGNLLIGVSLDSVVVIFLLFLFFLLFWRWTGLGSSSVRHFGCKGKAVFSLRT